jgi:Tfp pilus assembly protein PilO
VVLRQEVAQERSRVEALQERARTIQANTTDVARFYQTLGRKASLLRIQEDIAGVARQLGLKLGNRSYTNDAVKSSDSLARFQITMPMSGSYRQVVSFLQRIESLPHFVTVDSISPLDEPQRGAFGVLPRIGAGRWPVTTGRSASAGSPTSSSSPPRRFS